MWIEIITIAARSIIKIRSKNKNKRTIETNSSDGKSLGDFDFEKY